MAELTVKRLFSNPPLTGTLPSEVKFAPDGSYVAYLRPAPDDRERLDLWRMDLESGEHECWVDASAIIEADEILSEAEKAERERKRLFSTGITHYVFSPDGMHLLIPAGGRGYLYDIQAAQLDCFTPPDTRQTDFTFSPKGRFISYVRAGNLYYYDRQDASEVAVTTDGGGLITNGIADFIAQEEMHRFTGHWWSPDEGRIAFTRTDESPIAVSQRYEIDADAVHVIEQRYPYAGAANADVSLFVHNVDSASQDPIDYRHASDDYLARVDWSGERLAVQCQSRNQQGLFLDFYTPGSAGRDTVLKEQADTWINLHDNFKFVDGDRFLWTSEREGNAQLYLYSNGKPTRLTDGSGRVEQVLHTDTQRVIFSGWAENTTEQHVFSLPLSGGQATQLTPEAGWHDVSTDTDGTRFIDRFTSLDEPGGVNLIDPEAGTSKPLLRADHEHPYAEFLGNHSRPELGTLTAEDGQTLHYRLTTPGDISGQHPLVVYVYGGPGVNRVRNEWAPLLLQLFASRGVGVLELDNRGSSSRGPEFEAPIYQHMGEAEVRDQLIGARFAQSLDWVDPARIGVFGHSYGGFMTLMCLAKAPEVFKAGVSVAPVSAWELYDTHYTERYLGTPEDNPDAYARSAVFPYLDDLQGKLLIMHGMADDNVLFTHTTRLIKDLQSRCFPFEMMAYPGSKHALQEQSVSIHRFNMILDFFQRSL
jgi:dipeptidyl-peptidase-4